MINLGYPPDYYRKYGDAVRALTEQSLATAAAKFVRPDDVISVVIGDLKKIEAGIRELNYGEIVRLDADGQPIAQ